MPAIKATTASAAGRLALSVIRRLATEIEFAKSSIAVSLHCGTCALLLACRRRGLERKHRVESGRKRSCQAVVQKRAEGKGAAKQRAGQCGRGVTVGVSGNVAAQVGLLRWGCSGWAAEVRLLRWGCSGGAAQVAAQVALAQGSNLEMLKLPP